MGSLKWIWLFPAVVWGFLYVGWKASDRVPDDVVRRAQQVQARLERTRTEVGGRVERFEALRDSDEFASFVAYADRESWQAWLDSAQTIVRTVESTHQPQIAALLEENRRSSVTRLQARLAETRNRLAAAVEYAEKPWKRLETLRLARDSAETWVARAGARTDTVDAMLASLRTRVAQVKEDHPEMEADVDRRAAAIFTLGAATDSALARAREQLRRHRDGETADYARLADHSGTALRGADSLAVRIPRLLSKFDELDRSYTKILADMKADYHVQIGRSSWDNGSDYGGDHNFRYGRKPVSRETYEYFAALARRNRGERIAHFDEGLFGRLFRDEDVYIERTHWDALDIGWQQNWPSGDDEAVYWLQNWSIDGYHKYVIVENGERRETDWVQVDEETYWSHLDNLGMAIVSKPYGAYEEDSLANATPPGLAYVGDPHYGSWRTRGGTAYWFWHPRYRTYSVLRDGPRYRRYTRSEWNHWRRDYRGRRPYYGRNARNPTWGTWGTNTRSQSRYQSTVFSRSGGFGAPDGSVRGAGPGTRMRGPRAGK